MRMTVATYKNIGWLLLLLLLTGACSEPVETPNLEELFRNPTSEEAAPWTFWYWMYGAVSKDGLKADLEAMNAIGLRGAYLMPIRSDADNRTFNYSPAYDQLTPAWWELVRYAMEKADSLNMKLGMHICDGFALAGGPWITPRESMQKVVWSDTIIQGGNRIILPLRQPETLENYYKDIALFALPVNVNTGDHPLPEVRSNTADSEPRYLVLTNSDHIFRSSEPCWIEYRYDQPFICGSLTIVPGGNNFQAQRLVVHASNDGITFREIKQLTPPRQGWQNGDAHFTYSLPPTEAKYFRFYWDPEGTEPGAEDLDAAKWKPNLKIKQIILSSEPKIEHYEGKTGAVWRVGRRTTSDELPDELAVDPAQIITIPVTDLKDNLLTLTLPDGRWKIVRMGHTSTGHRNATGGAGKGLECNKFSKEAVTIQLENWFGAAFEKTDPVLARKVLKYMHVDSWECGSQNWSDNFPEEFKRRRGYDLTPWLLVYTGMPIGSTAQTEAILHDIRQTISELVTDIFYTTLSDFASSYDCELSAECVSPTMVSDGMMHYREVDRPMGEFWLKSPTHDKFNDMMDAISGAHIYGKKIIQAEGFTQLRTMWNEHPGMIKPLLDRNYALGMNKIFHHVFVHNPYLDRSPGVTLDGIGLYFQRNQTWWDQGRTWTDYIRRCQTLLQFGDPVVDLAVFTGEETPRRALLPERVVESLPGIFGDEKVTAERKRIRNEGQPLHEEPVGVTHSAGVTGAADWIDALNGYQYDSFNKDALLHLTRVKDGRIQLEGGMKYRILVLPLSHSLSPHGDLMSMEVAQKVRELQRKGVVILLGEKATGSPSFSDKNGGGGTIQRIADEIWSVSEEYLLPYHEADFTRFGLERDLDLMGEREIAWNHRADNNTDIYFLANQREQERELTLSFRCAGKMPELWDPVTGEITDAKKWQIEGGRTHLTLQVAPWQSLFVVFREPTKLKQSDESVIVTEQELDVDNWEISFESDSSLLMVTEKLFDWSNSEQPALRYYSGAATYETRFNNKSTGGHARIYLNLGELHDLAEVYVNDQYCGTIWTHPYRVEITDALKDGNNNLVIKVVNGWANRIKGVHEKEIDDSHIWTNATYWIGDQPLQPSGLMGPLKLQTIRNQ